MEKKASKKEIIYSRTMPQNQRRETKCVQTDRSIVLDSMRNLTGMKAEKR
jgi:hypothetical protein